MSNSDILLFEFVTRIAYNIEGLSNELKWYFSQYLTFHFQERFRSVNFKTLKTKKPRSFIKTMMK